MSIRVRQQIWNSRTGRCEVTLSGHADSVEKIIWGGEGLLYSASRDRTIKVRGRDRIAMPGRRRDICCVGLVRKNIPNCFRVEEPAQSLPRVLGNMLPTSLPWFRGYRVGDRIKCVRSSPLHRQTSSLH